MTVPPVWVVTEDFDDKVRIVDIYATLEAAQRSSLDDEGRTEWRPTDEPDQFQTYVNGEPGIYTVSKWDPQT